MVRLLTGKASSYCGTVCTEIKHAIYRRPCGECDYCRRHGLEPPAPSSAKSFEELDFSGIEVGAGLQMTADGMKFVSKEEI